MPILPTAAALLLASAAAPGATPEASAAASPPAAAVAAEPGATELSLAEALDVLDRANPTLAQARARGDEARAIVRQSWSALLPTLTAQGQALRNSASAEITIPPPISPEPRTIVLQPLHSVTVQGSARVSLLAPSSWWDVAAARDAERASDASLDAARRRLRASFVQAAHASRAAEELVVASEAAVQSAAELARSAARRVQAGTSPPLDRLRAETERTRRESDLAQARANLERTRLALAVLLGRERPVRVVVPEPAPPAGAAAPEALARAALAVRPELAAQRAQVDAAEAGVKSAWARLAPQVSASASLFASDTPYPTGDKDGWRATIDLTWPLYDGGFRYGKLRQAQAQLSGARSGEEAQRLAVVQEVVDASRDVAVAVERLRLAESQRRLAADAAASARRSFEAGVASSLDVIDANDRLYLADVGLADARARLAQAGVALDLAAGR
jgi:outer membrane protein TolC